MLWTVARQASLSMGFSRQEYWSGQPFSPPGDLPDPGMQHRSPVLQADSLPSEPPGKSPELCMYLCMEMWLYSVCIYIVYACIYSVYACIYTYIYTWCVHMCIRVYIHVCIHMCMYMCVYIYITVCACLCIYIYTHTHSVHVCEYIYSVCACIYVCVCIYTVCVFMYCVCVYLLIALFLQRTLTNTSILENPPSTWMGKLV